MKNILYCAETYKHELQPKSTGSKTDAELLTSGRAD
jgi:hypothetical protein